MILRRHKLEMPSFDVRACHHLGHANHYTNQQICIVLRAIGLLVWVLLNRVQSWRVTSRLIVCDGLWWFVEYRTIFSQSLEVVDTSRLIHRISLNLSLDVLNPAPQRILLPDSLSLPLSLSEFYAGHHFSCHLCVVDSQKFLGVRVQKKHQQDLCRRQGQYFLRNWS